MSEGQLHFSLGPVRLIVDGVHAVKVPPGHDVLGWLRDEAAALCRLAKVGDQVSMFVHPLDHVEVVRRYLEGET